MRKIVGKTLEDRVPLLLILLTLVVYIPGIKWGVPHPTGSDFKHAWGNDDLVPLAPLAEMHNTFVEAKPDRHLAYPWFHYFLVASAYGPYLVYLKLTGSISHAEATYPFGLADPVTVFRHLTWIGRSVTILLALATVLGAYYAGKHLWGRKAGFFSALFTMLMFPMAYYARLGNPDVPALAWTSLGLAVFALALRTGLTIKRAIWLGVFIALAVATKDQAAASFVFLIPALLWLHFRKDEAQRLWGWTSKWTAPLVCIISAAVIYVCASGIPVDPARYVQHLRYSFFGTMVGIYLRYPATAAGYAAQVRDVWGYLIDVMSWPLLIVAGTGIILAIRRDRIALILALSSLGCFLLLLPVRYSRLHYLLPVALPLNLFAAYALARGLEAGREIKIVALAAAIGVTGYLLLVTVDLTHDMQFDSRYAASGWLKEHTRPGNLLLYFGMGMGVPPLPADLETVKSVHRHEALPTIEQRHPDFILVMPQDINEERKRVEWRHGPHSIHSDFLPESVYLRLVDGSLGYQLVAQFQTPRLFPWLDRPFLSYPTVNPPIHIFARMDPAQAAKKLEPWDDPPYYPRFIRVRELTIDKQKETSR
jgi:dolichyl-phosphate-mannose-protein mannosyltransferase